MDEFEPMAISARAERIEPALRRSRSELRASERDRTSGRGGEPRAARGRAQGGRGGNGGRGRGKAKPQRRGFFRRALRFLVFSFAILVVATVSVVAYYASKLPDVTSWEVPERPPNIQILAADGAVIANRGDTGGANVTLEALPNYLWQAVVAIEDRRFYSHLGVDPIRLGRVLIDAVTGDDRPAGASTITQQLARTLFLTMDRTVERKIQEAILAVWLEVQYSKDDILEMYLNRVYFGAGAYGIDAAARVYFGKPAAAVTLAEAAMLAGVLPRPSAYAPTVNPDAARNRQLVVLQAMVDAGYISEGEADLAAENVVITVDNVATGSGNYVADWVADLVPDFIGAIPGDIIVETTIDPRLQGLAAIALQEGLAENGEALGASQGAFVAMSPDGAVRAMVGGRDYAESQYNRSVNSLRQPGSAFKPFVYLTAMEYGLTPDTIRYDQPINIDGWTPGNYTDEYLGPVTLEQALAQSLNTVSAQLTYEVGPAAVVATARRLGIGSQIEPHLSIALGTSEVSVLELTGAYATFANGGTGVLPYVITRIQTEEGDILYERSGSGLGQVIHPYYVAMMNRMLGETVASGTGRRAAIEGWPVAGKTGTSQEWRDAWFVGYSAHLVGTVWIGNDDNSPTLRATGGNLPASIWNEFMTAAHQGVPVASLPGEYGHVTDAQGITAIINQNGTYNEYADRYEPVPGMPAPPANVPTDRYNPNYDPRYDPNANQPLPPPPPASGPPVIIGQPVPPQGNGVFGGFFRRLFGN